MNSTMIRCFLETAKCGSFTKAASNLYFTQQTVSKYVSMLEKELHVPLLEREGAGVRLTKPGSYYFALFENCWYNLSAVQEKIDGYYKNLNSTLRIGCSEWINPYGDIFDAIEGFRRKNGSIRYSLRIYQNEHLMEHLMNEELDVALFSEAHLPVSRSIEAIPVCKESLCILGPASVVGTHLPEEQRQQRKKFTYLIVPGWDRDYIETIFFSKQEIMGLEIPLTKVRYVPNLASMRLCMQKLKYLAISDRRFGYMNDIEGLGSEPLNSDTYIYCCIRTNNENENVYGFIEYLKSFLSRKS